MFKNYFTITLRNIKKYKTFTLINVLGLATGIACSILILMWILNEYNYDKFHSKGDRVYRVLQHIKYDDVVTWAITQGPVGPGLKETTPEIENYARFRFTSWPIKYKDNNYEFTGAYTDKTIFELFDFQSMTGNLQSALAAPHSIVLTKSMAGSIFGNESPIGKILKVREEYDLTVTGIIDDVPDQSHLQFDFLSTMEFAKELGHTVDIWTNSGFYTYILLHDNTDQDKVTDKIYNFLDNKPTLEKWEKLTLQPLYDIHFSSNIGYDTGETINYQYIIIFSSAAIFILLVACINFMNLSTARASIRAREVGLRKVVGAKKSQLIKQFISESVLITFISLLISVILAGMFLPVFNEIAGKNFSLAFFSEPKILLSLFAVLILTGLISGSYPALVLSSFKPIKILRSNSIVNERGIKLRKVLVVFQYIVTAALLIGTFVVYNQIKFMQNMSLGYDKENIINFRANNSAVNSYDAFRNELLNDPSILNVCRSESIPTNGITFSNALWRWEGYDPENPVLFSASVVDNDFFDTYGIKIKEGRTFSEKFPSDSMALVINETAAKIIGYDDPVGRNFYYDNKNSLLEFKIIGVVEDYNFRSLHSQIEPLILVIPWEDVNLISVKLRSDNVSQTIARVENTYEKYADESGLKFTFLDESLNQLYASEENIGNILKYFAVLAIFISCLGLIGLSSFMALRRTKEIGVRKILGASVFKVIILL
ncbi:MAG: ABC transporter permease, partial [Ignavibacteria bacterium]